MIVRLAIAAGLSLLVGCSQVSPATPEPTPGATPTAAATAEPMSSPTSAATPTSAPTAGGYAGTGWTASALDLGPVGQTFLFDCPPNGSAGVVWGTDVYTADSSVCTAAVHAGVISMEVGGDVTIEIRPGQESYESTLRNGVTTLGYPSYDSSFVVVGAPQPSPSPSPAEGFGPFTPIFSDDFSDPTSGWGTGTLDSGTIEYDPTGVLTIDVTQPNQALRSTRSLTDSWNVLRIEASLTPHGDVAIFGLMCAESINEMVGALVTTAGAVIFVELSGGSVTVLARDDLAGVPIIAGMPASLAVECAGTATGSTRMRVEAAGELVGTYDGGQEGPASYTAVAVYGEAAGETFSLDVDDLSVEGGSGVNLPPPVPTASPSGVAELLTHVPAEFRDLCDETPVSAFDEGAIVAVACMMEGGTGAEVIEYVQFDSTESMNAAYQRRVAFYGAESTGSSCQQGPSEIIYTVNDEPAGRLLCAPQTAGIRFDWTDERLNILTSATDFGSSYPELYDSWLEAGPSL